MHACGKLKYIKASFRHNTIFSSRNMTTLEWVKIEDSSLPQFTIANITNYFVSRVTVDGKPANDFKELEFTRLPIIQSWTHTINVC